MNTCFAIKRWPEPHEWIDVLTNDLGLETAQISLDTLPMTFDRKVVQRYLERVHEAAASTGVTIHSLFTGIGAYSSNLLLSDSAETRVASLDWYRAVIELAPLVGASGVGGHVGAFGVRVNTDDIRRKQLIADQREAMWTLAEHAASVGLDHLQFENLAVTREYGHSVEQAHALEDSLQGSAVPWILCLDVGHPPALGIEHPSSDPQTWVSQTWRHTPVVQLQQSGFGSDRHGPFTPEGNTTGGVDRDTVIEGIRQWDADDVYLFFEILHPHELDDDQVLRELRQSVEYWKKALE